MTTRRVTLVLALWGFLPISRGLAQSRIGLALSGGAARGLAHIGVLRVLEQAGIPVDLVAGTSMGSVIGGLYAVGYSANQLDTIFTTVNWRELLTDPVRRRDLPVERKSAEDRYLLTLPIDRGGIHLPRSVVAGQRISELLTGLTWSVHSVTGFRELPIPFVAVATDIETGRAVVLDHGFLPDAIRASIALPSVFSPVEIENWVLIDGGVVRNLPAEDARALGADFLICSDVTDPLEPRDSIFSFVDVLVQSVSFRVWDSETTQRKLCDVLITPDVRAFSTFAFDRAHELIARGEEAARAALPQIEAAVARARRPRAAHPPFVAPESVFVATVRFDGPGWLPRGLLDRALGLRPSTWVSRRRLDEAIARLYATGLFESVHYRLDAPPNDPPDRPVLIVLLKERSTGRFGLGLRYDSRYKASVLFSSTLGTGAPVGLSRQLDVRLGQQIEVGLGVSQPVAGGKTVTLDAGADYARGPFDVYDQERRVAQARVDLGAVTASIARSLGAAAAVSARGKVEDARWVEEISAVDSGAIVRTFYTVAGSIVVDTYDRGVFPSRGVAFRAVSEWGNRLIGPGGSFSHSFADIGAHLPLHSTVSVWGGATVGASGGTLPPHYQFFLGGANTYYLFPDRDISFVGLHTEERRGQYLQKVELGVQWEFVPGGFGRVRWNAGTVLDRWTWDPAHYIHGVCLELGAKTVAGHFNLSVSWGAHTTWPIIELDLGQPF